MVDKANLGFNAKIGLSTIIFLNMINSVLYIQNVLSFKYVAKKSKLYIFIIVQLKLPEDNRVNCPLGSLFLLIFKKMSHYVFLAFGGDILLTRQNK